MILDVKVYNSFLISVGPSAGISEVLGAVSGEATGMHSVVDDDMSAATGSNDLTAASLFFVVVVVVADGVALLDFPSGRATIKTAEARCKKKK